MLDKTQWGPVFWAYLHALAATYPVNPRPEDIRDMKFTLQTFVRFIPCVECRNHTDAYFGKKPPTLSSRLEFFVYTVNFHNYVNQSLKKPLRSVEELVQLYAVNKK